MKKSVELFFSIFPADSSARRGEKNRNMSVIQGILLNGNVLGQKLKKIVLFIEFFKILEIKLF